MNANALYVFVLYAHSYVRWVVVALTLAMLLGSLRGWSRSAEWTRADERLHAIFVGLVDLQFTLGLLLYLWLSPYVRVFWAAPGPGMKDAVIRFFGVEHVFSMVIAITVIHIARRFSKRMSAGPLRHRRVFLSTLAALVLILIAIPWPSRPYGRPLLRGVS